MQDTDKSFEALVVPKSLDLTILVNSHNLQWPVSANKSYSLIKRDLFWKGRHKLIDKFMQHYHVYRQHNHQKKSYSYTYMKLPKRSFDSIALDLLGPFQPISKGNMYVIKCNVSWHITPLQYSYLTKLLKQLSKLTYSMYVPHLVVLLPS